MNGTTKYVDVKLIDFGMSKVDIGSNPKSTNNDYLYGTIKYMAPEVLRNKLESTKLYPFEANVYSFAMISSKIISNKGLFCIVKTSREVLERIKNGERSKLPSNCNEPTNLIEECWK